MTIDVSELKKKILNLLREDEEFRYAVAGLIGFDEILKRLDRHEEELKKLREDFNKFIELEEKRWEENNRRWEENSRRWEENNKRWEENAKRWEENDRKWEEAFKRFEVIEKKLMEHDRRFDAIERRLSAIGARWGIESEEAFREAMRGVLEEILGVAKVGKWMYFDKEGEVLGYPSWIEIDIAIKDQMHILVEIKASASDDTISKLWRIGKLYERITEVRPRLILVTPFIDEKGLKAAKELGIEIYTKT